MAIGTLAMIQTSDPELTWLRRDFMASISGSRSTAGSIPSD